MSTKTVLAKFQCSLAQTVFCGKKFQKGSDGNYVKDDQGELIYVGDKFQENITLVAVQGDENKPWSEYTPCGTLSLSITNEALLGHFQPGKLYMLEIKEAE